MTTHSEPVVDELRLALAALQAREERLAFLLALNDGLRALNIPSAILDRAARLLGEHLRVTRVGYAELGNEGFIIRGEYVNGVPPLAQGPGGSFGEALRDAYRRGETVVVHDVDTDARFTDDERQLMHARQIGAFVGVTLLKDGQMVAAFGANHASPRVWTPVEIELVRDVAERTWDAVDRTRADARLREREQRGRQALDASAGGSWTWDARTNAVDWDDRFRALYGFTAEQTPAVDAWMGRVHDEDRPQVLALLDEMLRTQRDAWDNTFRIVRPDGSGSWIQSLGRVERAADGQIVRMTGLELDVTERRHAEDARSQQRDEEHDRMLRTLLETATQGIVSVDTDGLIVSANRAFEEIFGCRAGALIGRPIATLMPSIAADRPVPGSQCLVGSREDGAPVHIEVTETHVPTPGGGRTFAFVTDITDRQLAASALRERTSELESRTMLLSRMASDLTLAEQRAREQIARTLHDGLQQLLLVASLNVQQHLTREIGAGVAARELVEAKRHLDEAIDAARSLSVELFPPVLHREGLPAALAWLANRIRDQYTFEVAIVADPRADSRRKDVRTLLYESVRELLVNAVKHAQADRATLELALDGDELRITVADEGIGFDPAALDARSRIGAAGWGLFSIQERLTLLGGRVTIDSAPGRGTRVQLVAPGVDPQPALRILIVDDHAAVRQVLRQVLHERPQLVVVGEAANGFEAMTQARALRPDAILMDIAMPHMDGIEATARIRAELPEVVVLGMSMQAASETVAAIERAGASAFFVKGTETERMIEHLVGVHQARVRSQ